MNWLGLVAFVLALGCGRPASRVEPSAAPAVESTSPPAAAAVAVAPQTIAPPSAASEHAQSPALEPLAADASRIPLDVEGFKPAVLSVPLGSTEPRPLVVALHGNFDRPDWHCELWQSITRGYPFILCPRGVPRGDVSRSMDRWEYGSLDKTKKELDAGITALETRFPGRLAKGPIVYLGFSLGAILGIQIAKKEPARFSRVVLIEGGLGGLDAAGIKRFQEGGGERILMACGQPACTQKGKALVRRLEKQGVSARVVDGGRIGHTYDGAIAEGIAREWPWLVEGLEGWPPSPGKDAGIPE
jgi:pimeloyl-ACP methyl ester carboxylesterase